MSDKAIFVPVAFSEEEALHVLGACRAVIQSMPPGKESAAAAAPLVQGMIRLAEAADAARAKAAAFATEESISSESQ